MRFFFFPLPILLAAFFVCCSGAGTQAKRPGDFSVEYGWAEGSLPPPYHYEYGINIQPDGKSQITFVPDYPSASAPKWVESFTVSGAKLDGLYRLMAEEGLFTREWKQTDSPPTGAPSHSLTVTAGGKTFGVRDYLIPEQEPAASAMFEAVEALVPGDIRASLKARRQQYVQEHRRH